MRPSNPDKIARYRRAEMAIREFLAARAVWHAAIDEAEYLHGSHGASVSGGLRDHWPQSAKEDVRAACRNKESALDRAVQAWTNTGRRMASFRRYLNRV